VAQSNAKAALVEKIEEYDGMATHVMAQVEQHAGAWRSELSEAERVADKVSLVVHFFCCSFFSSYLDSFLLFALFFWSRLISSFLRSVSILFFSLPTRRSQARYDALAAEERLDDVAARLADEHAIAAALAVQHKKDLARYDAAAQKAIERIQRSLPGVELADLLDSARGATGGGDGAGDECTLS
jgi:hypothetical protein